MDRGHPVRVRARRRDDRGAGDDRAARAGRPRRAARIRPGRPDAPRPGASPRVPRASRARTSPAGSRSWFAPALVAYAAAVVFASAVTLTRPVHNAILPQLSETPERAHGGELAVRDRRGVRHPAGTDRDERAGRRLGPGAPGHRLLGRGAGGGAPDPQPPPARGGGADRRRGGAGSRRPGGGGGARTSSGGSAERWPSSRCPAPSPSCSGCSTCSSRCSRSTCWRAARRSPGILSAAVGAGGLVGAGATAVLVGRRRLAGPIELGAGITGGAIVAVAASAAFGPVVALLVIAGAGRSFLGRRGADAAAAQRPRRGSSPGRSASRRGSACSASRSARPPCPSSSRCSAPGAPSSRPACSCRRSPSGSSPRCAVSTAGPSCPTPARLALLRSISLFQPLEQPALELLVHRLIPVHAPAGTRPDPRGRRRRPVLRDRRGRGARDGRRTGRSPGSARASTSARSPCSATCRARRP